MIPRPPPLLEWVSKSGKVCRVYRLDKAKRVLENMKNRERIIYVHPILTEYVGKGEP